MSRWTRFFSPRHYASAALTRLAPLLRQHLAHTPLIWGDRTRLQLGERVHLVDAIINLRSGSVSIGDDSFMGHGVMLLTGKHNMGLRGAARQNAVPDQGRDILIGKGVWIASGAIVIGPCQIGDNSVIGAGAVVTGDIPADSLHTGAVPVRTEPLRPS